MSDSWVLPEKFIHTADGSEGHFRVPAGSPWFSGHFPERPILPAIAMLGMVRDTLQDRAAHAGAPLVMKGLKRVRFRQIVGPESSFTVILTGLAGGDASQASFSCISGGEKACDGMVLLGAAS